MIDFGRPHVLDEALCSQICDLVAAGQSVRAAARIVGCDVKTIRRHADRDENFARLLRKAQLRAQKDPLKMLQRATSTSWRAAAWLLERTDPERYGRQSAAACRPEQLQEAFTRLLEAALEHIDRTNRRNVYKQLAKIAEEESLRLFLPPSLRPKNLPLQFTPIVDEQRLFDMLDERVGSDPPPQSSTTPGPKSPPSKTATNPGENCHPHAG